MHVASVDKNGAEQSHVHRYLRNPEFASKTLFQTIGIVQWAYAKSSLSLLKIQSQTQGFKTPTADHPRKRLTKKL